jgi:carboxymethylenebutenolidase
MRVEFPAGAQRVRGSLELPAGGGPNAGVIVIPDVWGLSPHYEGIARKLAAAGHAALAIDLYTRGESPEKFGPARVTEFIQALPDRQVLGDVQAAIDFLAAHPAVRGRRVGITGFCMGGMYAFLAACRCRGLSAAAPWYGMLRASALDANKPEHVLDAIRALGVPTLALFGAEDALIPLSDVEELRARAGRALETVVYPGAGHAFNNDTRPDAFRPEASADAWRRVLSHFERHLAAPAAL